MNKNEVAAVVEAVKTGNLDVIDQIADRDLASSDLFEIQKQLQIAKASAEKVLKHKSQQAAPKITEWLSNARKVRQDIESSRTEAAELSAMAAQLADSRRLVAEEAERVRVVSEKCEFAAMMKSTLEMAHSMGERVAAMRAVLAEVKAADRAAGPVHPDRDRLMGLFKRLSTLESEIEGLGPLRKSKFAFLMEGRVGSIREEVREGVRSCWDTHFNRLVGPVLPDDGAHDRHFMVSVFSREDAVSAADQLGLTDELILSLLDRIQEHVITPAFGTDPQNPLSGSVSTDGRLYFTRSEPASRPSALEAVDLLEQLALSAPNLFPSPISLAVETFILKQAPHSMVKNILAASIPVQLSQYSELEDILSRLDLFLKRHDGQADKLSSVVEWINAVPTAWLHSRNAHALDALRSVYSAGLKERSVVHDLRTPIVPVNRTIRGAGKGPSELEQTAKSPHRKTAKEAKVEPEEEIDVDAWGLDEDEDEDEPAEKAAQKSGSVAGEDDDAWGLNDDLDDGAESDKNEETLSEAGSDRARPRGENGYIISKVPEQVISIVNSVLEDALELVANGEKYAVIAPSAAGLCSAVRDILALFRATASIHYENQPVGKLLLYHDCLWLSQELYKINWKYTELSRTGDADGQSREAGAASFLLRRLRLPANITAIKSFAKEMQVREFSIQQNTLLQFLDAADSFAQLGAAGKARACQQQVDETIGFISDVVSHWAAVLGSGTGELAEMAGLLCASFVSAVTATIIEMKDISVEETERLASVCQHALDSLNANVTAAVRGPVPAGANNVGGMVAGEDADSAIADYVPNWGRLANLVVVLRSPLTDIACLWTASAQARQRRLRAPATAGAGVRESGGADGPVGGLADEIKGYELVQLLQAIFVNSDFRAQTIEQITSSVLDR